MPKALDGAVVFDAGAYLSVAEPALKKLLKDWQPKLMASHGKPEFDLKDDKSVVTELDSSLELAIKDVLRPLDESIGFLGEEHGQEGSTENFWLIDPIDGTEQYIRGMSSCRTLLCLIVNGVPEYALAYRFTTEDMFTAKRGQGTHKNGKRIEIIHRPLDRAWIEAKPESSPVVMQLSKVVRSVSDTHEFLNVVEGFVDGWISYGDKGGMWDYVPRAMLIAESGFKVTNIGHDSYDYRNFEIIAAHPDIFDQINAHLSPQT